jgi:hypothetical protein
MARGQLKRILEWKPIGTRIRGRPRKRGIVDIKDVQIMEIRLWRKNVKKEQNGRESPRRLKPTVGCNASKRRREESSVSTAQKTHCISIIKTKLL